MQKQLRKLLNRVKMARTIDQMTKISLTSLSIHR